MYTRVGNKPIPYSVIWCGHLALFVTCAIVEAFGTFHKTCSMLSKGLANGGNKGLSICKRKLQVTVEPAVSLYSMYRIKFFQIHH